MKVKIPNFYIRLDNYSFDIEDNNIFIGRRKSQEALKKRLKPKKRAKKNKLSYKGAYLVAGYRGMGKSTMVNKIIDELNKGTSDENDMNQNIVDIRVYLNQDSISENEFLRQLFVKLENKFNQIKKTAPNLVVPIVTIIVSLFTTLFFIALDKLVAIESIEKFLTKILAIPEEKSSTITNIFSALRFPIIATSLTILIIRISRWIKYRTKKAKLFQKIDDVKRRMFSRLEINQSDYFTNSLSTVGRGSNTNTSSLSALIGQNIDNTPYKQAFEKISTKELELEIKEILRLYDLYRSSFWYTYRFLGKKNDIGNILFVIDELDKIEPEFILENQESTGYTKSTTERRKETLSKLLSNLKSFIHTAPAKFVFIGGADMYEASLADIADRESFYSSIFHEVIYIPTFFKDFNGKPDSLTQMTEHYLYNIINNEEVSKRSKENDSLAYEDNSTHNFLKKLYDNNVKTRQGNGFLVEKDRQFAIHQIYRFIIYLTYRSNGSPKKLKELIEHYMVGFDQLPEDTNSNSIVLRNHVSDTIKKESLYIQLKSTQQYKTGVLSSLFMPYMLKNEQHKKKYNDKLLYLSAFLLDHILKFHKSAFSWRELELMPDIIIGSKTPNLRETLKELIDYLSVKHIRETTNAMFQYKFRSGTALELEYISKISDESAAAYNFTFDESHHLKAYYKRQLKQYSELYKNNVGFSLDQSSTVHTISLINSTIADINFYDENYDEAIKFYSDAVQTMRDAKSKKDHKLTKHQETLFTRNRLLLSLSLEKSSKYDSVYSILRSITLDQNNLLSSTKGFPFYFQKEEDPYKKMQIFLRPHLAILAVIEKDRSDGITFSNLQRNINDYTEIIGSVSLFPSQEFKGIGYKEIFNKLEEGDYQRVHTLLADYYQSVGSILFFKSNFLTTLFEWGTRGILGKFMKIKHPTSLLKTEELKDFLYTKAFKKQVNNHTRKHYYPSISAVFYFILSLEHLIIPFQENFGEEKKFDGKEMFDLIEKLAEQKNTHNLNGEHKFLIGLILSKLSDALLGSLHDFSLKNETVNDSDDSRWKRSFWNLDLENLSQFFSIENVLYLNILSYRFFILSGNNYDAFFSLKKCLYIIRTHFFFKFDKAYKYKNNFDKITVITKWFKDKCDDILNSNEYFSPSEEGKKYKNINSEFNLDSSLVWSNDKEELEIIYNTIDLHLNFDKEKNLENHIHKFKEQVPTIKNIFTRLQFLRYGANLYFLKYKKLVGEDKIIEIDQENNYFLKKYDCFKFLIENSENIQFCYDSLIDIYKTQGASYIMCYSYLAIAYNNLKSWTIEINKLKSQIEEARKAHEDPRLFGKAYETLSKWKYTDISYLQKNTTYYYEKIIQLHSEGKEYKNFIRELYILEDDFNDSLIHFCAALERSLINSGEIETKI